MKSFFSLLLFALFACRAFGQDAKGGFAVEYVEPFKGKPVNEDDFARIGPDADPCVKYEAEGLRITLPAGFAGDRPSTGVATTFGFKGDFEITVAFEILHEPQQVDEGAQTRFAVSIGLDKPFPGQNQAALNRRMTNSGASFYAWTVRRAPADPKPLVRGHSLRAQAKSGRLRLVRRGAELSFLAAEADQDFVLVKKENFGAEEVRAMNLAGATGGNQTMLDVRFRDLRIRAAALTKPGPVKQVQFVPPPKDYAQSYLQPFKGGPGIWPGWEFEGPNAQEDVRLEATGLRITLPQGTPGDRQGTGLRTRFGIKGDFEITMRFAILAEPRQQDVGDTSSTRLNLAVTKATPKFSMTSVSRTITRGSGRRFSMWASLWDEDAGKAKKPESHGIPTKAMAGRLRLVRAGADVYYGVAEGEGDGDFTYFRKIRFGVEDIRNVRIMASTNGKDASLDVRITDLHIRADEIPDMPEGPAAAKVEQAREDAASPPRRGWVAAGLLLGVGILVLVGAGLGMWFFLRRGPSPAGEKIACPRCGKALKASAGAKSKCPHCGKAVLAPEVKADEA